METTDRRHQEKEETFTFSLREIVAPLFRRKKILITTLASLLTVSVLAAIVIPAPYKAHMSILVRHDRLNPLVSTEATTQIVNGTLPITEEETNSEMELLKSHDVLQKVVEESGLDKPDSSGWIGQMSSWVKNTLGLAGSEADRRERAVRVLAKKLKVQSGTTKSNLIDVSYESSDPHQAYVVMNALANVYVEKHVEVNRPFGSSKFFAGEMNKYKSALSDSEQKLRTFSQDQGLSAPDVERTDLAQEVANAIGQLHMTQNMAKADAAHIRADEQQLSSIPARSTTMQQSQTPDKLLQSLNEQLIAAQTKRTQLAMKYDAHYPLVKEADDEIAQIKSAIATANNTKYTTATTDKDATYELIQQDLAKTRSDLAAQQASIGALRGSIKSLQEEMVSLDQKALQQHDLERTQKVNESNYLLYQSKWEQAQASDALDKSRIANVSIADPPEVPALPVYSISTFLAVAFGLSFLLSLAAVFIVDYFDPSFHTPGQVADVLEIPVVVAIPKSA